MAYVGLDFIKNVLRDDYLIYPADMASYMNFAETEINAKLVGVYPIPFDDIVFYAEVPALIQWIAAYLVGYKLYDERTSLSDIDNPAGQRWWDMAQNWLNGIVEGTYLLHLPDGTIVDSPGSTLGPSSYPSGVRDKAPSTENVPYFTRAQAGEW